MCQSCYGIPGSLQPSQAGSPLPKPPCKGTFCHFTPAACRHTWSRCCAGRDHAERRWLEGQRPPSCRSGFGDKRPPEQTCVQGSSHPFRTPEALTLASRALTWHLAGWGWRAAPHAEAKPHSCAPIVPEYWYHHCCSQRLCTDRT